MYKDDYISAVGKITASETWKQQTLEKMRLAASGAAVQQSVRFPARRIALGAAACAAIVLAPVLYYMTHAPLGSSAAIHSTNGTGSYNAQDAMPEAAAAPEDPALQAQLAGAPERKDAGSVRAAQQEAGAMADTQGGQKATGVITACTETQLDIEVDGTVQTYRLLSSTDYQCDSAALMPGSTVDIWYIVQEDGVYAAHAIALAADASQPAR